MSLSNIKKLLQEAIQFDIEKETADILNQNDEILAQMLRDQLASGMDGNNQPVTIFGKPFYHDWTITHKKRHGKDRLAKETNWITNYMTGRFYRSIQFYAQGKTFEADSDVPYFDQIILRSGKQIMQLNAENLRIFKETILEPELQRRWRMKSSQ